MQIPKPPTPAGVAHLITTTTTTMQGLHAALTNLINHPPVRDHYASGDAYAQALQERSAHVTAIERVLSDLVIVLQCARDQQQQGGGQ